MKKIAIVNQRYGAEVNGGSEKYARELAFRLSQFYQVDFITSTALDYTNWKPYYKAGREKDGKITVYRFPVLFKRKKKIQGLFYKKLFHLRFTAEIGDRIWIAAQGPFCPGAVEFIKKHEKDYDAFIFITYLYYITAFGLPKVKNKAILIPTAHDEKPIYFPYYSRLFTMPAFLGFLTEEERTLVRNLNPQSIVDGPVIGSGVEVPPDPDVQAFRNKYGIEGPYVIYAGRVDKAKGCKELFTYFESFINEYNSSLKLVVIGDMVLEDPHKKYIDCLGFVSEKEKYQAIAGARVLILPSRFESLSIAVLEAMAMGTPVLVNGASEVLKAHCEKSKAGFYYNNQKEFLLKLKILLEDQNQYEAMRSNGRRYIMQNYTWDQVVSCYKQLIEKIAEKQN